MTTAASIQISERSLAQARWLFGSAALYNICGALPFLFLRPWIEPLLHLDTVAGTNLPTLYLCCGFVILFGYAYILLARDPARYRNYIHLAIIGKLIAIVSFTVPWIGGQIPTPLIASIAGDPIYVVLFVLFLRSVPDQARASTPPLAQAQAQN
jgi:hypothetical protein